MDLSLKKPTKRQAVGLIIVACSLVAVFAVYLSITGTIVEQCNRVAKGDYTDLNGQPMSSETITNCKALRGLN